MLHTARLGSLPFAKSPSLDVSLSNQACPQTNECSWGQITSKYWMFFVNRSQNAMRVCWVRSYETLLLTTWDQFTQMHVDTRWKQSFRERCTIYSVQNLAVGSNLMDEIKNNKEKKAYQTCWTSLNMRKRKQQFQISKLDKESECLLMQKTKKCVKSSITFLEDFCHFLLEKKRNAQVVHWSQGRNKNIVTVSWQGPPCNSHPTDNWGHAPVIHIMIVLNS